MMNKATDQEYDVGMSEVILNISNEFKETLNKHNYICYDDKIMGSDYTKTIWLFKRLEENGIECEYHNNTISFSNKGAEEINYVENNIIDLINTNEKIAKKDVDEKFKTTITMLIATKQEDEATERISAIIQKLNHIKTVRNDAKSEMYYYDQGIYKNNGETRIKEQVREILQQLYTPIRNNKIIAKIQADTGVDEEEFFSINYVNLLPIQNGLLDLETKKVIPFSPDKIFFNKLPIKYDPNKECPNIDKFLKEVLQSPKDSVVMYEIFGYSLYKDHFIEKAFMFEGDGRNGKGKLLSLFKAFLGANNCCSVALSQMNHQSTGIIELKDKLVNIAGDLSPTALKETGLFKEITGRDLISAKRKYFTDLAFVNYSKQIFACNELPRVYDMSIGFWSRWMPFKFPYTFVKEEEYNKIEDKTYYKIRDEQIVKKLITEEELSGLLNKALEGLDRILEKGDFSYSIGTKEVKDLWIRKADSFNAFCMDNIIEDEEGYITKKELRRKFARYTKIHKLKGCSDNNIKINLENNFGVIEERKTIIYGEEYNQERCWVGIKWKDQI